MKNRMRIIGLAVASGVLLGIGSRFPVLWFCSLVAFAPLMYALTQTRTIRAAFWYSAFAGMCAYGLSFHSLFWDSLPLTWLGVVGWQGVLLIFLIWSITVLLFAGTFGLVFALVWRFALSRRWVDMLIIPSAYVLAEWIGAWVFCIFNYGPFSLWGPNFTMGSPAYQLASDGALLQLSSFGGLYALTFVQACVGVGLYRLYATHHALEKKVLCTVFIIGIAYLGVVDIWFLKRTIPEHGTALHVALINIYEPSVLAPTEAQLAASYAQESGLIRSVASSSVAIIALPEDSRFLQQWHVKSISSTTPALEATSTHAVVIDSASEREDGVLYSRTEYFDPENNTSVYSYKQFLMPLGEEHPYVYQGLVRLVGQGKLVNSLLTIRGFHTKPYVRQASIQGVSVAALLCSEGMSPVLYADQARKGAQVFFNLASNTWFHESRTMQTLSLWNSKVRAVESSRYYARPADDSPAFILDPFGRIIASLPWETNGVLYGTVYARTDVTVYMRLGQWVLLLPLFLIVLAVYMRKRSGYM